MLQAEVKKELYSWILPIGVAVVLVFICRTFIFTPVVVKGESMEPTFDNQDRILVNKIGDINRFDMIVFHAPDQEEQYIKRVIGLPGDEIIMKDDVLYVNGIAYDEEYVKRDYDTSVQKITGDFTLEGLTGNDQVPNGYFFVLGDNRLKSKDSRALGLIEADAVIGKVKFRYYPFTDFGLVK